MSITPSISRAPDPSVSSLRCSCSSSLHPNTSRFFPGPHVSISAPSKRSALRNGKKLLLSVRNAASAREAALPCPADAGVFSQNTGDSGVLSASFLASPRPRTALPVPLCSSLTPSQQGQDLCLLRRASEGISAITRLSSTSKLPKIRGIFWANAMQVRSVL